MNEIEKLYDNAGVQSFKTCEFCTQKNIDCLKENTSNITCGLSKDAYPPFTAEKQIKLLKFLSKLDLYGEVILRDSFGKCLAQVEILDPGFTLVEAYRNTLEEAIAAVINKRWEYLTEKQKQEVKEILDV